MAASNSATRPSPRGGRFVGVLIAMRRTLPSDEQLAIRIVPGYGRRWRRQTPPLERNWRRELMRALIAGGGMAGLMTALALRQSGAFTTIDVFEQTRTPSTAGAGLNIPPNAPRLSRGLGAGPDRGDPKGPPGAVAGGRGG